MISKSILLFVLVMISHENFGMHSFVQKKVDIFQAIKNGDKDAVEKLISENAGILEAQNKDGWTPLHSAVFLQSKSLVTLLLSKGANIEAQDKNGWTPLYWAVSRMNEPWATFNDKESLTTLLLSKGANIEAQDNYGNTPLHGAVFRGNGSLVTLLLDSGANIEAQTRYGGTPLHRAVFQGTAPLVILLLSRGANIEARYKEGLAPLHCAVGHGYESLVTLLLAKGADINAKADNGVTPLMVAVLNGRSALCKLLLKEKKLNKNMRDSVLMGTAIHTAGEHNQIEICKLLIENGFDPNERAGSLSLLHRACKNINGELCNYLFDVQEDLNVGDKEGDTPLHHACRYGHVDIVEILLTNKKVNPNAENLARQTPLGFALERKNEAILKLLLTYGALVRDKDLLYAAQYGLVVQSKLLAEHVSKKVINRLKGQLASLVSNNEELIRLFGIYQSLDLLPHREAQLFDVVPEQTSAFREGLQVAQQGLEEQYEDIDQVSEPSQYGDASSLVAK